MHDYGLKKQNNWGVGIRYRNKPFKKVLLINVNSAKNRITVDNTVKHLEGSLCLPDWERKQAIWLVEAVVNALEKGEKTADITKMFSCEFITEDDFTLPQWNIQNELMNKLFWRVDETGEELRVKLTWKAIFL